MEGLGIEEHSWPVFLAEATAVFVAKNADYEGQFMQGLMQYHSLGGMAAARTIWAWEVEKKLTRCRTWIKRGELQVKGEGVRDSVIDLFVYTVQFSMFQAGIRGHHTNPMDMLNAEGFESIAKQGPDQWLHVLTFNGLMGREEKELQSLLLEQMTGLPF